MLSNVWEFIKTIGIGLYVVLCTIALGISIICVGLILLGSVVLVASTLFGMFGHILQIILCTVIVLLLAYDVGKQVQ